MSTPSSLALVSIVTGRVQTFVRADLPAGYTPPEGYTLVAPADLPEGWQLEEAAVDPAAAWNEFLAGSITDPTLGIALKANRQARNDFIGQATLLREAVDAGVLTNASAVSIWDANEVEHILTVAEVRALLLRYGIAWQSAFNALAP